MSKEKSASKDGKPGERKTRAKAKPTIEESLAKLDKILEKMEDDDTGLEETFRLYEEGLGIIKQVNAGIEKVESRIKVLSTGEGTDETLILKSDDGDGEDNDLEPGDN